MKWRAWLLTGSAVLVVAIASAVGLLSGGPHRAPAPDPPAKTVKVALGKLTAVVSQSGILTYSGQPDGSPYSVVNQASGTYTKLPGLGQVISQGQVLYRVNDSPVVLLNGATPAYRSLSAGASGPDVAELNADLVALGYASQADLSPTPASFGAATSTALNKLLAAVGLPQNATLALGQAVFEPTDLRVTVLSAQLGAGTQTGQTVMQATSTARQVQMALDASQQADVAVGDQVSITLPNNRTTPGTVSSVGTVATCPSNSGAGGPGSSSAPPGTDPCSSGRSGSTTPTIAVGVTPSDPAGTGTWDQAPVQVGITTASVPSALSVPVTALLAQPGGGYVVEVVGRRGIRRLVPVSLGLFDDADGLVQVTGSGLAAGQDVVVPTT